MALAKVQRATGDTLARNPSRPVRYAAHKFPRALSFALTPKNKGDEEKVSNALKRLSKERPGHAVAL